MREALADDLLPGERGPLHAALARALESDPALSVSPSGVTAELAFHWFAAHNLPAAFSASAQAGAEAMRLAAFAEANAHYERAIELWDGVPAGRARGRTEPGGPHPQRRGGRAPRRRVRPGRGARPPGAVARRRAVRPHDRRAGRRAPRALPVDQRELARGAGRVPCGGRPPSAGRRSRRPCPGARLRGPPAPAARAGSRGARALRAGAGDRAHRRRAPRGGQHPQHDVRRAELHRRAGSRDRARPRGHAHRPRAQRHRGDHAGLRQPRRDPRLGRAHRGGGRSRGRGSAQRDRAGHQPAGRAARLGPGAAPAAAGALGRGRRRAGHRDRRGDQRGHGGGRAGRARAARRPARALRRIDERHG